MHRVVPKALGCAPSAGMLMSEAVLIDRGELVHLVVLISSVGVNNFATWSTVTAPSVNSTVR